MLAFCPGVFVSLRAHSNVRFFLGRMSTPLPEKGTAAYYEAVADEPSDFIDDGPEEGTAAAKAAKKAAAGKVALQAKNFQDAIAEKAAKETAQKEIDVILAGLKPDQQTRLLAAMGVVAAPSTSAPRVGRYDHEASLKRLMVDIAPVRAVMETHKDNYWAAYYMGSLSAHLMSSHNINAPANKTKKNEHTAFLKYFRKVQHNYGLGVFVPRSTPSSTPSIAGSKSVSRTSSVALVDNTIDESMEDYDQDLDNVPYVKDDAGAGAD
jgi:hypothetical protein